MNPLNALLRDKQEDRFTVLLAALMEDSRFLGKLIDLWLKDASAPVREPGFRVNSHLQVPGGVADIVLQSNHTTVIIEAKLGAGFTPGQPQNYAKYLSSVSKRSHQGYLVLLVPQASSVYFHDEAMQRLTAAGLGEVPLIVSTWERVAELCKEMVEISDGDMHAYLGSFAQLIEYTIGSSVRPLTDQEAYALISPDTRRAFGHAKGLLDLLVANLKVTIGIADIYQNRELGFWYGTDFTWKGRQYWIGLWFDVWIAQGRSPLWVQMCGRKPILPGEIIEEFDLIEHFESWIAPLCIRPDCSIEDQIRTVSLRVETFLRLEDSCAG